MIGIHSLETPSLINNGDLRDHNLRNIVQDSLKKNTRQFKGLLKLKECLTSGIDCIFEINMRAFYPIQFEAIFQGDDKTIFKEAKGSIPFWFEQV